MVVREKCPGVGRRPEKQSATGLPILPVPVCPFCGRDFSTQSRRQQDKQGNIWREGFPMHFRNG